MSSDCCIATASDFRILSFFLFYVVREFYQKTLYGGKLTTTCCFHRIPINIAEFVAENEQKDDDKDKDQEANTSTSYTNQSLHATVHDSAKDNDTDLQDEKINEYSNVVDSAAKSKDDTLEEIHWTKSTRYINSQKECTKFNGEVLLDIYPLDNPLKVFEKLISLNFCTT